MDFTREAQKKKSSHQCLFALLGSLSAKAARKMLMKFAPVDLKETELKQIELIKPTLTQTKLN